ncbi:hypothetical protein GCM10027446_28870 [Angustibacter peucedani]
MTALAPVVSADAVWEIVVEIWESLLGSPVLRAEHAFGLDDALTAGVALHGGWSGLVTVTCPPAAADALARTMLALDEADAPTSEDVEDALGEVANVLGGNVKALVPGAERLGLPRVGRGLVPAGAVLVCRNGIEWQDHVARVAVWQLVDVTSQDDEKDGGQGS